MINSKADSDNSPKAHVYWLILLWTLVLYTPYGSAINPRSFDVDNALNAIIAQADNVVGFSRISLRVLLLFYFGFCSLIIIKFYKTWSQRPSNKLRLLYLFLFGIGLSPILAFFLGVGTFQYSHFSLVFIIITTLLLPYPEPVWFVIQVRKAILLIYIYGSICAALLFPEWAMQHSYETSLAILDFRLYGMTNHPNTLGPLALLFLILAYFPRAKLRGEYYHRSAAICVLLLSQSKTTWAIALILIITSTTMRWIHLRRGFFKSLTALVSLCTLMFFLNIFYSSAKDTLDNPEIITLTGRLLLWVYSLDYWLESPWIGHGYAAWDSEKALDNLSSFQWAAPNAHNQFLQTLTEAGIIGEFFLIGLISLMIVTLIRCIHPGRNTIIAVLFLLLGRSMTEVVISYSPSLTMLLFWVVIVLIISIKQSESLNNSFSSNNS